MAAGPVDPLGGTGVPIWGPHDVSRTGPVRTPDVGAEHELNAGDQTDLRILAEDSQHAGPPTAKADPSNTNRKEFWNKLLEASFAMMANSTPQKGDLRGPSLATVIGRTGQQVGKDWRDRDAKTAAAAFEKKKHFGEMAQRTADRQSRQAIAQTASVQRGRNARLMQAIRADTARATKLYQQGRLKQGRRAEIRANHKAYDLAISNLNDDGEYPGLDEGQQVVKRAEIYASHKHGMSPQRQAAEERRLIKKDPRALAILKSKHPYKTKKAMLAQLGYTH